MGWERLMSEKCVSRLRVSVAAKSDERRRIQE